MNYATLFARLIVEAKELPLSAVPPLAQGMLAEASKDNVGRALILEEVPASEATRAIAFARRRKARTLELLLEFHNGNVACLDGLLPSLKRWRGDG